MQFIRKCTTDSHKRYCPSDFIFASSEYLDPNFRLRKLTDQGETIDLKLMYRHWLTCAYITYLRDTQKEKGIIYRAFLCNTYVEFREEPDEQYVLVQIAKTMCNSPWLIFWVYNARSKIVLNRRIDKIADVRCDYSKKVDIQLIEEARVAWIQEMDNQQYFYRKSRGINISNHDHHRGDNKRPIQQIEEVLIIEIFYNLW